MAEGTNVGAIYYTTTLETQGLVDARRKVDAELKKAGDAGDALQFRFSRIAAAIGAAIAAIGVEKLVSKLVAVQREFDAVFTSLKTAVGGSLDVATQQFEQLKRFAAETPYSVSEATQAFVALRNFGLDPSERAMRSFGDTAVAMNKSLMQFVEAVADAATGQWERLAEFGIKAKLEGNKVAFTFKGIKTEVKNNADAITEYLVRLGETNFGGTMSERAKTLDGDLSELAETWDSLFRTVSQAGVGDAIASAVRHATEAITQLEASVRRGELTEYFDTLRPVLQAAEVAATSLAAVMAGRLVASLTASTSAALAKVAAEREAARQALAVAQAELTVATVAQRATAAQYGLTASLETVAAASARVTAAQEAVAVAQARVAAQATVASVAARAGGAVLAALGGPIGIAITGLTLLALNWDKVSGAAKSAAEISEQSAGRIRAALSRSGGQPMKVLQDQLSEAQAEFDKVDQQLTALGTGKDESRTKVVLPFEQELLDRREAWRGVLNDTKKAVADLKQQQMDDLFQPEMPGAPKSKPEPDKNLLAKAQDARAYYQSLVAANAQGLARINAEEQQALADNRKRMIEDKDNAAVYAAARAEIVKRFARERALLEEQTTQEIAEANIQTTTDEAMRVEMIRVESVRRAEAAEKNGVMTHEQAERAKTAATVAAEQARADLTERNARARAAAAIASAFSSEQQITLMRDEEIRQAQAAYERGQATFEEAEAAKTQALMNEFARRQQLQNGRTATQIATLQIKAESGGLQDQEALIRAQAEAQIEATRQAQMLDLENAQIYAGQRVEIEARMNRQIADLRASANIAALSSTADAFGSITSILKQTSGEQSGIYKAMFAAQKAFSIASSIVAIQTGIAKASSLPFPANLAAMASVAAATASIVSTIAGTNYGGGRQYGGPVSDGTMYRVNEKGAPEMFTAANGTQYMLPTSSGRVTPADQVGAGAGVQWQIIVNNNAPGTAATASVDQQSRTVTIAVNEVASQITERRGPVWGSLSRTTNVQGRV